tara:strand:- start:292 stop:417 length:126 start_codon:yes stop_codon:yes gene_type:complete
MKQNNLEEKIEIAEQRIAELNKLIEHWRLQNDYKRKAKESG